MVGMTMNMERRLFLAGDYMSTYPTRTPALRLNSEEVIIKLKFRTCRLLGPATSPLPAPELPSSTTDLTDFRPSYRKTDYTLGVLLPKRNVVEVYQP
jgi:hypothetical protein